MRIKIIGECNSAKVLRGYLRMAGVCVTDVLPPAAANFILRIEEGPQDLIICDSVPSELEKHVLEILHEFLSKLPNKPDVQLRRSGGQVRGDRELLLIVPAADPLQQDAAERAAYLGLLRTTRWGDLPAPAARVEVPKKSLFARVRNIFGVVALLLMAGAQLHAAPPDPAINVLEPSEFIHSLLTGPPIFPQIQFPRFAFDATGNLKTTCNNCSSSSFTDNAAFTPSVTPVGIIAGWYSLAPTNCTSGSGCGVLITATRHLMTSCDNCSSSSFGDNSAFTAGSTSIGIFGGWYSTVPTNCTSGNGCAPQLTLDRKLFVQDFQGTSPWVDNITQWASGNLGAMANYGTSPGAVLVPGVNSFITNIPSVAQSGNWTSRIVGNVGGVLDAVGQNAAAPANWLGVGCTFFTSPTTLTTGNGTYLNCDTASNILTRMNSWLGSTAPTVGSKTSANSIPVVIANDQGAITVTLTSTTITGTVTIAGTKTNNNAAPGANNDGVLPAIANAATQAWTEGDQVSESVDLSGRQRMRGTNGDNDAAAGADRIAEIPGVYQTTGGNGTAGTQGRNAAMEIGTDGRAWTANLPARRPASYYTSTGATGVTVAASATDIAIITGNATTDVEVTKLKVSCTQTTAGVLASTFQVVRRSTADTAGTETNLTVGRDDTGTAATSIAAAGVGVYTVNPTTGTLDSTVDTFPIGCMATGTPSPNDIYILNRTQKPIVLQGTAQQLAVNLNGKTVTGGIFYITWEWIEETHITP